MEDWLREDKIGYLLIVIINEYYEKHLNDIKNKDISM